MGLKMRLRKARTLVFLHKKSTIPATLTHRIYATFIYMTHDASLDVELGKCIDELKAVISKLKRHHSQQPPSSLLSAIRRKYPRVIAAAYDELLFAHLRENAGMTMFSRDQMLRLRDAAENLLAKGIDPGKLWDKVEAPAQLVDTKKKYH